MYKSNTGQAVVEYLFVFVLFAGLALSVAKGIGAFSNNFFKSFAYTLSQELTTGSCGTTVCWHSGYENGD